MTKNEEMDSNTQKIKEAKDLYTYVNNICLESMFVTYKGLKVNISDSAMRELFKNSKSIYEATEVLERGTAAPRKRRKDIVEKWLAKGNKTYNAVIAKSYDRETKEEYWVLIHFGKFKRRIK
jgi:arginyl-tRNA synthetase